MPRRIVWLAVLILFVFATAYVFYLNPHTVAVNYSPSGTLSVPLAATLTVVFWSGVLFAAIFAILLALEYQVRIWRFDRRERLKESHRGLVVSARELIAAGMYGSARERLQKILSKDQHDTVARVQLAETLLLEDKSQEALQVLDEARGKDKNNLELLFVAADVNQSMGNVTGAYDNYQLILRREPRSPKALMGLVSCCRSLERFDEAVQYQIPLLRAARGDEQTKLQEELADLEVNAIRQKFPQAGREYRKALEELLVRHRDFPPALRLLAIEEREVLKLDQAAKLLVRAYRAARNVEDLELLADLWLQAEEPGKAVAAVKSVVLHDESSVSPADARQLEGRMFLVALLIFLENIEEARAERKKLEDAVVARHGLEFGLRIIDSWLKYRQGELDKAFQELFQGLAEDCRLPGYSLFSTKGAGAGMNEHWVSRLKSRRAIEWQPAPELSTP